MDDERKEDEGVEGYGILFLPLALGKEDEYGMFPSSTARWPCIDVETPRCTLPHLSTEPSLPLVLTIPVTKKNIYISSIL